MKSEPEKVNVNHTKSDTLQGEEEARVKKVLRHKIKETRRLVNQRLDELEAEVEQMTSETTP